MKHWVHDTLNEGVHIAGATISTLAGDERFVQPNSFRHAGIRIIDTTFPQITSDFTACQARARVTQDITHLLKIGFVESWYLHFVRLTFIFIPIIRK